MKKILIFSFLLVVSLSACQNKDIKAEDIKEDDAKYYIEKLEYRSDQDVPIEESKEINGKKYTLINYEDQEIGVEKGYDVDSNMSIEKNVREDKVEFPDFIEIDGRTYKFKEVKFKEGEIRKETIKQTLYYIDQTPSNTYVDTYFDELSETNVDVIYKLVDYNTSTRWIDDLYVPITVFNYYAFSYQIGNGVVTASPENIDISAASSDILAHENMDPSRYQLSGAYWNGEPYEENGVYKRNAVAYGRRLQYEYTASYECEIELPQLSDAEVVYEWREENPEKDVTIFERTIIYGQEIISPVMLFSIGLVLFIAFVLLFLFKIRKTKEKEGEK